MYKNTRKKLLTTVSNRSPLKIQKFLIKTRKPKLFTFIRVTIRNKVVVIVKIVIIKYIVN